ncbi:MAG: hypothetical protein M3029_03320 [Lactobacillus helsingborgensis]|nr:hypothetical protein [Lactobacillus helsingborgensis]
MNIVNTFRELNNDQLQKTNGGKFSFPTPSWSQARDTIWGIVDGICGHHTRH